MPITVTYMWIAGTPPDARVVVDFKCKIVFSLSFLQHVQHLF